MLAKERKKLIWEMILQEKAFYQKIYVKSLTLQMKPSEKI